MPIVGAFDTDNAINVVTVKLEEFGLNIDKHIVSLTSDGARVMTAMGRRLDCVHIECLSHGLHLAILKVLYNKEGSSDDVEFQLLEDEESEFDSFEDILENYKPTLKRLRDIVKTFTQSGKKEQLLLEKVKEVHGKELKLILDVQNRWNSLYAMVSRGNLVMKEAEEALMEYDKEELWLSGVEKSLLRQLENALMPCKLLSDRICQRDTTLLVADAAFRTCLQILKEQKNPLCNSLHNAIEERFLERRSDLTDILLYFNDPKAVMRDKRKKAELLKVSKNMMKRLYNIELGSQEAPEQEEVQIEEAGDLKDRFMKSIDEKLRPRAENTDQEFSSLAQELAVYDGNQNKMTPNLSLLKKAVESAVPTSVEPERTFSISRHFLSYSRTRMSDDLLDCLVFLKHWFLHQKKSKK